MQQYLSWDEVEAEFIEKSYLVLVIYDIVDDKRRRDMVKVLESFGVRVQKSAFECVLSRKKFGKLIKEAPACIDDEDSLRIYLLDGRAAVKTWGKNTETEDVNYVIL